MSWFVEGGRSTSFFHRMAKIKQVSQQMTMLRVNDCIIDDNELIEQHMLSSYRSLYLEEKSCEDNGLTESVIPSLVTFYAYKFALFGRG